MTWTLNETAALVGARLKRCSVGWLVESLSIEAQYAIRLDHRHARAGWHGVATWAATFTRPRVRPMWEGVRRG